MVDEERGQVVVGVVRNAGVGDGLQELGLRELPGQQRQMLVYQRTQRDPGTQNTFMSQILSPLLHNSQEYTTYTVIDMIEYVYQRSVKVH